MKQTFTDIPAAGRLRLGRGRLKLGAGVVVVALLLLGNLVVGLDGERLERLDAAHEQPPHWRWLQRLLYRPLVRVEGYGGASGIAGLLEAACGGGEAGLPAAYPITSQPVFTAVVGRPYRYRVRAKSGGDAVRYRVSGPAGMTIDAATGLVTWTPDAAHNRVGGTGEPVTVCAVGPEGAGSRQRFTVFVAERAHPLGTDRRGRDLAAALVLGTRWTLLPGLLAVGVSLLLGLLVGAPAGYYAGRADAALTYLAHLSEAVPALLLLFLAAVIFHYRLYPVMAVLGVILFPGVARGVRAEVLALKARQFVEASRELGLRDARILWKDIVWHNTRPFLVGRVFHGFALAVAVEVTLSYLRLGIQAPAVSWGTMIFEGRALIPSHQYWLAFFPAVATVVAVGGFYLLGHGLAQRFRIKQT